MHSPFQRLLLVLALASAGCDRQAKPSGSGPLLPNYVDRGIVILDPNPQRPNYWDFDLVSYGDRPEHTFRLKNLDSARGRRPCTRGPGPSWRRSAARGSRWCAA